jgi:lipid-A-disaccharide synthase
MGRRIFITVADPSADQHAAKLIAALRQLDPEITIDCLGGPRMAAAGATVHYDTVAGAAMGWRAALRARAVAKLIAWARSFLDQHTFDLAICIDSWTMNWHFARLAKERGIPVMYYIAPQTWASREKRVLKMREYVDRVACILPFEEQYFRRHGLAATFVGHPLFDDLPQRDLSPNRPYDPARPTVGLLPGSRKSIAEANFPRLLAVARDIEREIPQARFLIPATPNTEAVVRKHLGRAGLRAVEVAADAFNELVPRCDLVITVSGTAALHTAAFAVPLIVVYYGNPVLWHLIGRWVVKTRTYSLVNLLSDFHEHIVPEFIPWYGPTSGVSDYALGLLRDPEKLRAQREKLLHLIATLDRPGASMNAAKVAMEMMTSRAPVGSGS